MALSTRCPKGHGKMIFGCAGCAQGLENYRILKARYLARLHAENQARRAAEKKRRKTRYKNANGRFAAPPPEVPRWDESGRCGRHGIEPELIPYTHYGKPTIRRHCRKCRDEASRKGTAVKRKRGSLPPVARAPRFSPDGLCLLHDCPLDVLECSWKGKPYTRRECAKCRSEASLQAIRTRRANERRRLHDARLQAPAIDCGDVWEVFTSEVFRAA